MKVKRTTCNDLKLLIREMDWMVMMKKTYVNLVASIYNMLPQKARVPLNSIRMYPGYLHWLLASQGRKHTTRVLKPYEHKYTGCRCVVIGNGPSLKTMDLSLLKNEFTFGLNRIYMLFEEWGFETTFLVSVNRFVLDQFAGDFRKLKILKLFYWAYRSPYHADENTVFLTPKIRQVADGNICSGIYPVSGTVTNVALEIAYFMGFSEVVLIGVDHSFAEKGVGNAAVIAQGPDQNHFSPNYFGPGVVWQLPDYVVMEQGYAQMKKLFEQDGRKVVDATVGGKLQVFPKVSFEEYLNASKYKNKKNYES